jgi:hypothetical protein
MKGISATVGDGGNALFFWLDQSFVMHGAVPGYFSFGGVFTSAPVAIAATVPRPLFTGPGGGSSIQANAPPIPSSEGGAAPGTTVLADPVAPKPVTNITAPDTKGIAAGSASAADTTSGDVPLLHVTNPMEIMTPRLDLFGLGTDYGMYHKRSWGTLAQSNDLSAWEALGGVFTSSPAAIAWGTDRVDVFGLGTDHAMYQRTANGDTWSPQWQSIGGTFSSAASLVLSGPQQLNLFARGADFTLRGNHTDGTTWFGFENHGGNLASPPVAVSWGADRIDVFAVFNDGSLQHIWWDGAIWNAWENLGGNHLGEPAAVSWAPGRLDVFLLGADGKFHHHWFSNDTWALPEVLSLWVGMIGAPPTAISTAANQITVFVPTTDNAVTIATWNGQAWTFAGTNPTIGSRELTMRIPSRYKMSVDNLRVITTRSKLTDTDAGVISVAAGNAPVQTTTQWLGDVGVTGLEEPSTNLLNFSPISVDLAESVSFSYQIVNNGHADQSKILAALAAGGDSLSLAVTASMEEDIGKGIEKIISASLGGAIKASVPVVGSILAPVEDWLMGQLTSIVFSDCDGVVAVGLEAMMGRDLFMMTNNGTKPVIVTTTHNGTTSPVGCGGNSVYQVTWSITPL